MIRLPAEPMLAVATDSPALPPGWAAEPKWDGFRGLVARDADGGRAKLVSRRGTDLSAAFPEITAAATALPPVLGDVSLDGEVVIWEAGRLDFGQLLARLNRRPAAVRTLVEQHQAHFIAFDLLHLGDRDLTRQPYRVRRAELEHLFAEHALTAPWTLCPSTTDPAEVTPWLTTWTSVGIEGACYKPLSSLYLPGRRGWRKYRVRDSAEVVVGAVTGSLARPSTLLVGTPGAEGRLHFLGRTTPLAPSAAAGLTGYLAPAGPEHPWQGRKLTSMFVHGPARPPTLVEPGFVVEVVTDSITDSYGRWRHSARYLRPRPDLTPADLARPGPGELTPDRGVDS